MDRARQYSRLKYSLAIADTAELLLLLYLFTALGLSKLLGVWLIRVLGPGPLVIPAYLLIISSGYYVLGFPLNIYCTFILERRFSLSNQKLKDWFIDQLKGGILSYLICLILIYAFYFILEKFALNWWIIVSLGWVIFGVIMARVLPTVIIPMFFKYQKISDEALRQRIIALAERLEVKVIDVFQIDLSKKTLKANAAFVGLGRAKRVILADTLKGKYSPLEIDVILAHEFAHYRMRHLLKLILANSLVTAGFFYLIYRFNPYLLGWFGFSTLVDIGALPLVLLSFAVFGIITQPLLNYFSRRLETNADKLALLVTGQKEAFISLMEKLAMQNLADRNPHPLIKFLFFDHPSIDQRIAIARRG